MKNTYSIEINNCCKCPHHYQEIVFGCYCSKVEDKCSYNKKHKLVVADEDVERWAEIPNWCPMLSK